MLPVEHLGSRAKLHRQLAKTERAQSATCLQLLSTWSRYSSTIYTRGTMKMHRKMAKNARVAEFVLSVTRQCAEFMKCSKTVSDMTNMVDYDVRKEDALWPFLASFMDL